MNDLYLGLMSGTSVDALDVALCRFKPEIEIVATADYAFPVELRQRINRACLDEPIKLDEFLLLERDYSQFVASSVTSFLTEHTLEPDSIRAIGFHGQTLRHRPDIACSLQMGNPNLLAERSGICVVADFRRRDLAAGGEGAPLVPAFHKYLVESLDRPVGILNLGGIANLSLFNESGGVLGFDTGPANTLMDQWIEIHRGVGYDERGQWAASGNLNEPLLKAMLAEPYFQRSAPKSTGRELFNLTWLRTILEQQEPLSPADVQRTLLELTAQSLTQSIEQPLTQLIICGGGAENSLLMERIRLLLPNTKVHTSDELGWPASHMEAVAFAWLAKRHLECQAGNLPEATGAVGPRILGAHYPA